MNKRIRRFVFLTLFVMPALVVLAGIGIHLYGGRAAKYAIESVGGHTLKVGVNVEDVSLSILRGRLELTNLDIANPPGYQHERMLQLASGRMETEMKSLLSDTVAIRRMDLDGITLVIEQKDIVQNNLHEVLKSLPSPGESRPEDANRKKLRIDTLTISNVKVRAKLLPIPGRLDTVDLTLAPIEMKNLGHDNKLTLPILVAKVLQAIAAGVAEKGRNILPREMIDPVTTLLGSQGVLLRDATWQIIEKGAEAGKGLTNTVAEGLKGLLPGRKED